MSAVIDLRNYQTGTALVLFDIRRHISIEGREPTLAEAKRLAARWLRVDSKQVVA